MTEVLMSACLCVRRLPGRVPPPKDVAVVQHRRVSMICSFDRPLGRRLLDEQKSQLAPYGSSSFGNTSKLRAVSLSRGSQEYSGPKSLGGSLARPSWNSSREISSSLFRSIVQKSVCSSDRGRLTSLSTQNLCHSSEVNLPS